MSSVANEDVESNDLMVSTLRNVGQEPQKMILLQVSTNLVLCLSRREAYEKGEKTVSSHSLLMATLLAHFFSPYHNSYLNF